MILHLGFLRIKIFLMTVPKYIIHLTVTSIQLTLT